MTKKCQVQKGSWSIVHLKKETVPMYPYLLSAVWLELFGIDQNATQFPSKIPLSAELPK
jgi:hypothetical protein